MRKGKRSKGLVGEGKGEREEEEKRKVIGKVKRNGYTDNPKQ